MIAVVSLPIDRIAGLPGRPITPFGWEASGRCYALDLVVPPFGLASAICGMTRPACGFVGFRMLRPRSCGATHDALERGLA